MIIDELFESPQQCPECGGISFSDLILAEKKDACYHKVKASAKVWPSAYASGRLVQCRKKGAANYGNKSEGVAEGMDSQVVFSGTGDNGSTYEIIQSGPTDFMIHANGRHIDTYGSLQRAMSVLKNEVPGLQQGMAEAGFPGAPDVEMPPMKPSGDPERDKLKNEYVDLHREIKSLVDAAYGGNKRAKARIAQLNDRADQIRAILEPRQPPNEWQKKTYGYDDNWNIVKKGVAENNAVNVPPGQQAITQPDGSTRISKPGSVSRADYAKNMAAYKAQTQTPEKIADFKQRMASGQGYTDTERQANLQQQQQHFGKFADTGDLDEDAYDPFANDPAADAKHEAEVRARMQQQLKQGKGTSLKDMPSIDRDQYLKNTNRTWDEKTQRSVPATKSNVQEVSLGDYRKKAQLSQAGAKINKFFGRDDAAKVAAADRTISKREKGLSRADARSRPYTVPPVDKDKQRQELTDKYPNIDQLVSDAEKNRDPYYDRAEGNAYYAGREAEQNYVRLKQIQRIIQGLNEETRQATLNTPAGDFTVDITKDKSTNTVSGKGNVRGVNIGAVKDMTPGGSQSVSADMDVAPGLNISATRKSADYNKGQLGGTKSVSAKYTDTAGALGQPGQQHTATRTTGIGFGGASGPRVGKNYVDQFDKTLADYMKEAKGINSIRNPYDLQPLEAGGGMGGGGGRTTSGPSPFGPKPGSREASVAQNNPNTMTIKQTTNPDYVPPKTLQQKYDELNKKLDQLPPTPPVKTPRPGRAAAAQRQKDQAQAAELKDVVPLSPAERNQLRPVDANDLRRSNLDRRLDLDDVRPGLDEQSRKKREEPEVEYDDEYDAMVARVKKLAGLGPLKTVYDPKKRQYRNMPIAVQPKK